MWTPLGEAISSSPTRKGMTVKQAQWEVQHEQGNSG